MSLKQRIRQRIEEIGTTPTQVSRDAGLNATYVRDILMHDDPNPRIKQLDRLAKALETSREWLLTGEDSTEVEQLFERIPENQRPAAKQMLRGLAEANRTFADDT